MVHEELFSYTDSSCHRCDCRDHGRMYGATGNGSTNTHSCRWLGTDLTNQNSPEAATFTTYPALTKLHTPAVPVGLKFIAGGFTAPITIADPHDGSGRLFMVDQTGYVKIFFMNGTVSAQPFLDLRDRLVKIDPTYDERGLLSIAFHPQFATNGRVFVYYSAPLRAGVDPNWSVRTISPSSGSLPPTRTR